MAGCRMNACLCVFVTVIYFTHCTGLDSTAFIADGNDVLTPPKTILNRPLNDFSIRNYDEFIIRTIAIPTQMTVIKHQTPSVVYRLRLVTEQLAKFRLQSSFLHVGAISGRPKTPRSRIVNPHVTRVSMQMCINATGKDMCLFFEDDTVFHPEFPKHVMNLIKELPPRWQSVHFCPIRLSSKPYRRDRTGRNMSDIFNNLPNDIATHDWNIPLKTLEKLDNTSGNSFFYVHPGVQGDKIFVGTPTAFLLRREMAPKYLQTLIHNRYGHNDVVFARPPLDEDSYITKTPQMCYHLPGPSVLTQGMSWM